jgi:hypothetical protein
MVCLSEKEERDAPHDRTVELEKPVAATYVVVPGTAVQMRTDPILCRG